MADVEFIDNSIKVNRAIEDAIAAFLDDAGGEIISQTVKNYDSAGRVDTGQTKGSFKYVVDESKGEVVMGSPLENAIWEEFGTGEYAVKKNGRKGGWYIHESKLSSKAKSRMKRVEGKDGKVFYFTLGKKPNRPFEKAYNSTKSKIIKRAEQIFKSKLSD